VDASSANDQGANDLSGVGPAGPVPAPVPYVPSQPAGPQPPQPLMPSQAPARVPRSAGPSPWPMRIAIFVGVLSLVCVGGLGVAYHLYDKATAPNRSAPDVTLAHYLQSFLVEHNDADANQYVCSDQSGLAPLRTFRSGIEPKAGLAQISVGWAEGDVSFPETDLASVPVSLTLDVGGGAQNETVSWTFELRHDRDWCVSSALETS
jgi:hypothetical protein